MRQLLVKGLDGRTLCLGFDREEVVSGGNVAAVVSLRTGIPVHCVRLVTGTAVVREESLLRVLEDGSFPSCTLLLRLPGGKGGFGSLLRGAATKAGQKKTSNFDACRDMSGRRLRHVNAEKKLKEWKADAEERELEKTAEDFLKKATKAKEEDNGVFEELEKFRAETSHAMGEVELAVASGLVEARKSNSSNKRKVQEEAAALDKRARIWMGDADDEDDSDEESMDEDERPSSSGEAGDADVAVTTPEQVEPSLGPSVTTSQVKFVKTVVTETEVDDTEVGVHRSEKVIVTTETSMTVTTVVNEEAAKGVAIGGDSLDPSTIEAVPASCVSNGQSSENVTDIPESSMVVEVNMNGENAARVSNGGDIADTSTLDLMPASHDLKCSEGSEAMQGEPLNFSNYQSAEELEV